MRNPAFIALLDEIRALHDAKNSDYAADSDPLSNFRRSEAFGVPAFKGVLVRLSDKWSRIEQLTSGKVPKNESLRDSLIDSAVYSLIAILLMEEQGERGAEKPSGAQEMAAARTETVFGSGQVYVSPDVIARTSAQEMADPPNFPKLKQAEPEVVAVGPQGYVPAEHVRMSR